MRHHLSTPEAFEPSAVELAAIEAEWPAIEAELELVDAEARLLTAVRPSALDWRRLRRAERHVLAIHARIFGTADPADVAGVA